MHFVAFPLPLPLFDRAQDVMMGIRGNPSEKSHRTGLFEVVNDMADEGIDFFFLKSIRYAGMSTFMIKTADIGLRTFKAGLQPLLRKVIQRLSDDQILRLVDFMEDIFVETADED